MCLEDIMKWKKKLKILKLLCDTLYKYCWYKQRNIRKNGIEIIAGTTGILWLNEKHIEGLDEKNLWGTTLKYLSDHRKRRHKLVDETKKKTTNNRIFVDEKLAIKVIMNCRTQHINLEKKKKKILNNIMSL